MRRGAGRVKSKAEAKAAGLPKPDISILSDQFLAEVRGLKHKNVAAELLAKLLKDEIKVRMTWNLVQSRQFSELLQRGPQRLRVMVKRILNRFG